MGQVYFDKIIVFISAEPFLKALINMMTLNISSTVSLWIWRNCQKGIRSKLVLNLNEINKTVPIVLTNLLLSFIMYFLCFDQYDFDFFLQFSFFVIVWC